MTVKQVTKFTQSVSMSSDVREMLYAQAKSKGLSISSYIERLILREQWRIDEGIAEKDKERMVNNGKSGL